MIWTGLGCLLQGINYMGQEHDQQGSGVLRYL
jgi:hypothetical protein